MNPLLATSLARLEAWLREDERCPALFLAGSLATGKADVHSDVDLVAAIRDEDYERVAGELPARLAELCGPIAAWLPEGETENACNYAFLYHDGGEVLLYDFAIVKASVAYTWAIGCIKVLFDPGEILRRPPTEPEAAPAQPFTPERVRTLIETYWVYAYLNGKYMRRDDRFKLAYVQGALFHSHFTLLNALVEPEEPWTWWARDLRRLDAPRCEMMLAYFGGPSPEEIRAALRIEFDAFGADGRAACARYGLEYPAATEAAVRGHLARPGCGV